MKEKLRLAILEAYGIDIDKYDFTYQNSLHAYTINIGEYTIRVTTVENTDKESRLARMQWALDLKEFKNTICEPMPSKNGELIEELSVGKWRLYMSMFRTAKGQLLSPESLKPMQFIALGDMIGTMHNWSMVHDGEETKYNIPSPYAIYEKKRKAARKFLNDELNKRIDSIIAKSMIIPKTKENFGVCYGEYDLHNIIMDTNNVYLFDFDGSIYAHYLYDVASFAVSLLASNYQPTRSSKDILFNTFIPWFRIGYSINKPCKNDTFDDIETYMALRGVWLLINFIDQYRTEELPDIKLKIDFISAILMGDDFFDGVDKARKYFNNISPDGALSRKN